jgi:porin
MVSISREHRQPTAALLTLALVLLGAPASVLAQASADARDPWQRETLTGDWGGLRTGLADSGVTFGLQEQSELWGNVTGGLRQGGAYDGLLTASLAIDLHQAVGWEGANLFVNGFQIQGVGPTPLLVGALQSISNIEAAASVKLYDLWFEQQLLGGTLSVRLGQEGANDEMMLSQYASLFLNSSFGFPALPALDLPSGGPNYPLATPFVRVGFQATGDIRFVGAVYNGDPAPPGTGNPQLRDLHGTAFRLNDHTLSFGELWYTPRLMASFGLPATYKLGLWVDTGRFADPLTGTDGLSLANPASNGQPLRHATDHAVYAIIDQMVWRKPNTEAQGISLFVQVMHASEDRNLSDLFVEGGLDWKGIIPGRSHDAAGLAVTYAGIGAAARHFSDDLILYTGLGTPFSQGETVAEATYRARLTPWFKVQPDLQLVLNPGAGIPSAPSPVPLKNALVFGVRVTVNF